MSAGNGETIVRLYFNDDSGSMNGFLIAVTTDPEFESSASFEEGRTLKDYFYEPITLTREDAATEADSDTPDGDDMLWLILEDGGSRDSGWENFEPAGLGATLTKSTAERVIQSIPPAGNLVLIGIKNGWRYGFDPVPDLLAVDIYEPGPWNDGDGPASSFRKHYSTK